MTDYNNLLVILNKIDLKDLANELNISKSTISRWIQNKKIPNNYSLIIHQLLNKKIDYSKYSYRDKDQFFTNPNLAKYCYNQTIIILSNYINNIDEYVFIEPSAGDGVFFSLLPINRRIGLDIEPRSKEIIEHNYLTWMPPHNKNIIIGNPPFGLRGQLALKFINHSYEFSDFVCFILPQLFISDGKGSPRKRVKGFNLVHSEFLNTYDFLDPDGKKIKVRCIFQIWSKCFKNKDYVLNNINNPDFKIYSLTNGGTPSTTRNKDMINKCHVYIPSTCFGKLQCYYDFNELPNKRGYGIIFLNNKDKYLDKIKNIPWETQGFLSTNSATNIRTSQINELLKL